MVIDDLWLYQYHQQEYDGIIKVVFETIALIEEKQWNIIGLGTYLEEIKAKLGVIHLYNPYSNEKYMR